MRLLELCHQAQAALAAPDFLTFGSPKSANHHTMAGFGIIEGRPHNAIHRCVGSRDCNFMDAQGFMNNFPSPVDPVFFLHHANLDRLWDVWTRKQQQLGLPVLPNGFELRTDLPDDQKSAEEKNTDYYRWAREPVLFFVDAQGRDVTKTRAGDYAWTQVFDYDYEPGTGRHRRAGQQHGHHTGGQHHAEFLGDGARRLRRHPQRPRGPVAGGAGQSVLPGHHHHDRRPRRLRVVPIHAMMGHHGMGGADSVELLSVNVEAY